MSTPRASRRLGPSPARLPDASPPDTEPREGTRGFGDWTGPLVVLLLAGVIGLWQWHSEERAFSDLPETERRALFERTLENLREVCPGPSGGERAEFCRSQAELVVRFPECDAECLELARLNRPFPTR